MTTFPAQVDDRPITPSVTESSHLPNLPGRTLTPHELQAWVAEFSTTPEKWEHLIDHNTGQRHYAAVYRDANIDVWLLCWNTQDDTGWHDHDISSGAVSVVHGNVRESRLRIGDSPEVRTLGAGSTISFGPDVIHRMDGIEDGAVSIHCYSPPLWRMGQYSISESGALRRVSVSYADELRPI